MTVAECAGVFSLCPGVRSPRLAGIFSPEYRFLNNKIMNFLQFLQILLGISSSSIVLVDTAVVTGCTSSLVPGSELELRHSILSSSLPASSRHYTQTPAAPPTSPCLLLPPQNSPGQLQSGDHKLHHRLTNINN